VIAFQDPSAATSTTDSLVAALQSLGWVDKTALAVLLVFFVLGLFKGLIWQVSRIGILLAAYFVAGRFGHDVALMLGASPAEPVPVGVDGSGTLAYAVPEVAQGETTIYVAYCLLFVGVLIVLSLLAMLIKKLADRAGLGFFDRLGGGVLGVATGACVVLAGVFGINMFFPSSNLAQAAGDSHSLRWSQKAIGWLGDAVDDDLRSVLSLQPLEAGDGSNVDGSNVDGVGPGPGGTRSAGDDSAGNDGRRPRMPTPLPLPRGMKTEGGDGSPGPSPGRTERGGIR
jgi:uncharacterized membrane protein required for colicin V production